MVLHTHVSSWLHPITCHHGHPMSSVSTNFPSAVEPCNQDAAKKCFLASGASRGSVEFFPPDRHISWLVMQKAQALVKTSEDKFWKHEG